MKKLLPFILLICSISAIAQDEGTIVKRERIERDKSIFVGGGVSIINNSELSEYSAGFNFEGGYMKRLNRIVSIGGSLSYLSFAYSTPVTKQTPIFGKYPDNFYSGYDAGSHEGYLININNTKLTFTSLSLNLKFNFVPVKDNSTISFYGFAKPFVSMASYSDVDISVDGYVDFANTNTWTYVTSASDIAKGESKISGGIFLGPGVEFSPAKPISIFAQASFGYTFPSDFISTKSYPKDLTTINDPNFPIKNIGFTSINFAAGISFNLD